MANITEQSIFGVYEQPENQVTSALLQIMKIGGEDLIKWIFDEESFTIMLPSSEIKVETQPDKGEGSRPDGSLEADFRFRIYIESKLHENQIDAAQLTKHVALAESKDPQKHGILVYITNDDERPQILDNYRNVAWLNWEQICYKLKTYETNDNITKFLIAQFELMLDNMNLIDKWENRVLIVGGNFGEPIALKYRFYACQNHRSFRKSKYLAFAYKNRIEYLFEIVGDKEYDVDVLERHPDVKEYNHDPHTYFELKLIHTFNPVIENDALDKNKNRCAFVQSQTYTTYEKIIKAKKTSDLS